MRPLSFPPRRGCWNQEVFESQHLDKPTAAGTSFHVLVPVLQSTFLPRVKLSILLFEGQGTSSHFIFTMKKEDFKRLT